MMNELQKKLLKTFNLLLTYLEENNINYYVIGGTLLGTIRHNGFIPWDDDIDIGIPRSEYNKLIDLIRIDKDIPDDLTFEFREIDNKCLYMFGKVYNNKTTLVEGFGKYKVTKGIYIDIFPLDLSERDYEETVNMVNKVTRNRAIYIRQYDILGDKDLKSKIKRLLKPLWKIMNIKNRMKMIDNIIKPNYVPINSKYILNYYGLGTREIYPVEYFSDYEYKNFQNIKVRVPKLYDDVLTRHYGNYMELPNEEDQVSHHIYSYMDLELPYKDYKESK